MGIVKRLSYALLSYFGIADVVRPRRPSKLPSVTPPRTKPATAARRPPVTPQKVTEWRKARQEAERVTSLLGRAKRLTRLAARPTTLRSAEFVRSARRLLDRIRCREGRLSVEGLALAAAA